MLTTSRIISALALSVLFFFLFMFVGEASSERLGDAGLIVTFFFLAAYFFACQFRLSRGRADALPGDWPVMLALNTVPLVMILFMIGKEKWPVILGNGLVVLIAGWGGTIVGALAASRAARKRPGAQ